MILPANANTGQHTSTDPFEMLAMENPLCEEKFYFDEWKPSQGQQGNLSDAEIKQSWRGDSFEEQNGWMPPTTNMDTRFNTSISSAGLDALANWKDKPVEQWSADEVTLWICSLMNPSHSPRSPYDVSSYSSAAVNVAAYLNLSGAELMQMSSTDIQARDPQSGPFVFMSLQNYLSQANSHYNTISSTLLPSYSHMDPGRTNVNMHTQMANMPGIKQEPLAKEFVCPRLPSLDFKLISFDIDDRFPSIPSLNGSMTAEKLGIKYHTPLHNMISRTNGFNLPPQPFNMSPNTRAWNDQQSNSPMSSSPMISPRSEGSVTPPQETTRDFPSTHYPYTEVKGNHLWEFIRDLLFDSRYNPSLVKWEDREEGIFKFVKSDQVAKLWGKKKNNPAMTYEKLSRAMRYYYRRKILERIDGRRLVYKFGSMATGWKA